MERLVWTPSKVVDVDGPRAMLRAYLEQRDVRPLLATRHRGRVGAACDVVAEILRIMKPDGTLLLCEETDVTLEAGDRAHGELGYTCGRAPEVYGRWLAPWRLVAARPRVIEPGYPRPDVGTYLLFVGPDSSWTGVPSR